MDRYFIRRSGGDWHEVSEQSFIAVEQSAGFRSKFGPDSVATGGFSSGDKEGYVLDEGTHSKYIPDWLKPILAASEGK